MSAPIDGNITMRAIKPGNVGFLDFTTEWNKWMSGAPNVNDLQDGAFVVEIVTYVKPLSEYDYEVALSELVLMYGEPDDTTFVRSSFV